MFRTVLTIFHIIIAIGLIAGVLLQSGKSAGLSGSIDGGATAFFGKKKGMDELLTKITTGVAAVFMITSFILAALR